LTQSFVKFLDVSSVLLPVMESAAKNIVNYLNVAQSVSPQSPQVLPPTPHFLQEDAPPQLGKNTLTPKLAASYAEMIHKAFHKFAVSFYRSFFTEIFCKWPIYRKITQTWTI
jgi:gamma-glutamyltranspeptidase